MNAQELTLNIAVNLGRLSRWAYEGKTQRVPFFLKETEDFLSQLEKAKKQSRFLPTFTFFKTEFAKLKQSKNLNKDWAEDALTWANILTHRAKLA